MRGCITKKSKTYSIVIYLGRDEHGKKKQKWFNGYKTKKEAERDLPIILNQFQQNTFIEPIKTTLSEYLRSWLANYVETNLSPTTLSGYKVNIEKHLIPAIGNIELQKLQPIHIQNLYNKKQINGRADGKGGLSAKSIIYIHRVLRKALQQAFRLQLVNRNVADYVELPKAKKFKPSILNIEQILKMLEDLKNTKFYIPVLLAVATGLRRGEVLGLRWADIDSKECTITINQNLIPDKTGVIITTPKTENSHRTILVSQLIIQELLLHKEKQDKIKKDLEEIYYDHDLVNCKLDGLPLNPSTFSSDFSDILKKLKLPHVRFHDLRHMNATIMLKSNIPAKIASERLGHSTIGITLDLYSHVLNDMQKEAAETFDRILFIDR